MFGTLKIFSFTQEKERGREDFLLQLHPTMVHTQNAHNLESCFIMCRKLAEKLDFIPQLPKGS